VAGDVPITWCELVSFGKDLRQQKRSIEELDC
jgi:hypothetical protein